MRTILSYLPARALWLLGLLGLGLAQTGCAQPIWVEPSVVVQARVGGPVYGPAMPMYGPSAVVVAQAPVWGGMPAPVYVPPRVVMPAPVYRPGWWGGYPGHHHHEHDRGEYGRGEYGRGGHGGWR